MYLTCTPTRSKEAKTPIIAGTICGFFIILAWSIGFTIYLRKRRLRNQRLLLEGKDETEIPPEDLLLKPSKSRKKRDRGEGGLIEKRAYDKRQRDAAVADEEDLEGQPKEKVIIPPDPAVLLGVAKPGEYVIPPPKEHHHHHTSSSRKKKKEGNAPGSVDDSGVVLSHTQSLTTEDILGGRMPGPTTASAPQLQDIGQGNPASVSPPEAEPVMPHSQSTQDARSVPTMGRINEDVSMPGG